MFYYLWQRKLTCYRLLFDCVQRLKTDSNISLFSSDLYHSTVSTQLQKDHHSYEGCNKHCGRFIFIRVEGN